MKTNSQIWDESLEKLKGNWGIAILAAFVSVSIMSAPNTISQIIQSMLEVFAEFAPEISDGASIVFLLILLVATPFFWVFGLIGYYLNGVMTVGLYRFFIDMNVSGSTNFGLIFKGFKQGWPAFGIFFMQTLLVSLWALTWLAPVGVLLAAIGTGLHLGGVVDFNEFSTGMNALLIVSAMTVWLIPGFVIALVKGLSYSMALFILAENPDAKILESIGLSKKLMNGNKMQAFMLSLRVSGLVILSFFTLFIGLLWVIPWSYEMSTLLYDSIFRGRQRRAVVEIG